MKGLIIICLSLCFIVSIARAQSSQDRMGEKPGYQAAPTSPDEIITSFQENDRTFEKAMTYKDVDEIMTFYWNSPDLAAMFPDGNYKGFDAVRDFYTKEFSDIVVEGYSLDSTQYEVHGDVAIEYGYFTMETEPKTKEIAEVASRGGIDDNSTPGKTNDPDVTGTTIGSSRFFQGQRTTIWELKDGKWLITLDHVSIPPPPADADQVPDQH